MTSLLPQPYCQFDPEEWTAATGVPSAEDTSKDDIPAVETDCPFKSQSSCPVHKPVQGESAPECANRLLKHFAESPPQDVDKQRYYAISGIEVAGFDLCGQTLYAEQAKEIDLRHLIVHGEFSISGGAIANRFTVANSLFRGDIAAKQSEIDERLSLNHSRIEGDISFNDAELHGGLELRNADIEGSLSLRNVTIAGDLDLSEATITKKLDLTQARILGNLKMSNTRIAGECNLREAQIEGAVHAPSLKAESIYFDHATVGGHIILKDITAPQFNCNSIRVEGAFNLVSADIDEDIACNNMNIEGETLIALLDVGGDLTLKGSQLNHLAILLQSKIEGTLNLEEVDARHHLNILTLEIGGDFEMGAAELGSFTILGDVSIKGELRANTTNAEGAVTFQNITVREDAKLRDLLIEENLVCLNSSIAGKCDLSETRTKEQIKFEGTRIGGKILAKRASIGQQLDIVDNYVSGAVELTASQLGAVRIDPDSVIGGFDLTGSRVTNQPCEITGVRVRGDVVLDEAVINRGVKMDEATTHAVSMEECSINGPLTATDIRVGYPSGNGAFEADQLAVKGDVDVTDARIGGNLRLTRATIKGNFTLETNRIRGVLRLGNCHLHGEVVATNVYWGDVDFAGATLEDDLLFLGVNLSGGITAQKLTSKGDTVTIIRSSIPDGINVENVTFSGDLVISHSNIQIENPPSPETGNSPRSVIQATGATVGGELLLESDVIHGNVDISEATIDRQLRITSAKDDPSTIIGGKANLADSIIEQQLILRSVYLQDGVLAKDIRVGSKTIVEKVTGNQLDFSKSFFKWNVKLEDVFVREVYFTDATLQNRLVISNTVVSRASLILRSARIHDAEVNRGYTGSNIDCTEAVIEELTVNGFNEATIWDEIKIEKTRFDGFDFTDFTTSLHKMKHRIHHNRDVGPVHKRFTRFFLTLGRRLGKSYRFGDSAMPTRNLELMREFREQHLNREITYRRAKESADSTSDNIAASQFYRLEKKHRRRRRFWEIVGDGERKLRNTANYGSNLLLGAAAGHGERISYVVLSAIFFLFLFTGMYLIAVLYTGTALQAAEATPRQSFVVVIQSAIDYLFLSIASFANLPGTIPERASPLIRFISYIERLVGAAYIPLLVFTLTRSLHR